MTSGSGGAPGLHINYRAQIVLVVVLTIVLAIAWLVKALLFGTEEKPVPGTADHAHAETALHEGPPLVGR